LPEIILVGLGLHDENGISVKGLEAVKSADTVFMEQYTSVMPGFSLRRFEDASGKKIHVLSRYELEEENGKAILEAAEEGVVVLLVSGDPLIATTHVTLRIEAKKRGILTRVVHGASVLTAVIGLSCLHSYKFGKSVTVPFPDETLADTPYDVISQNRKLGLHTLCLLDIKRNENRYLGIDEALGALLAIEEKRRVGVVTRDSLIVGVARAGSDDVSVKAGAVSELAGYDFGGPPFSLVFTGKLHFMEAEALIFLAGAPEQIRRLVE